MHRVRGFLCSIGCAFGLALFVGCQAGGYPVIADTTPEKDWPAKETEILTNVRQLTSQKMGLTKAGEAYFSPDMKTIIFQAFPHGLSKYQMYTLEINPNGTAKPETLKQVNPSGGACTCGFFRPDGAKIIYCSTHLNPDLANPYMAGYKRTASGYAWEMPGGMDIIEANIDGSNPRQLTNTIGYDAECAYSPDGKLIVFSSDRDGEPDLYVMNADGSGVRQITNKPGYDGGPFFSPDGKRIVFRADRLKDDCLQLHVVNIDGTHERQLTENSPVVNWAPYWHPNGRSIVWATSVHGHYNYEVYLMNTETGKMARVTCSPGFDGLPVFSPDGKWLMWTSKRSDDGSSQVFLADFKLPEGF